MSGARSLLLLTMFIPLSASVWAEPARRIEVYAHRGARSFAPENTMVGYTTAVRIGADWIDMDVVLTSEHEVLLSHDLVLNPDITRDEHGEFLAPSREALKTLPPDARAAYDRKYAVRGLTLKDLQQFDVGRLNPASAYSRFFPDQVPADGTRMPTLRDVVRFADTATRKTIRYQVEMKTDPAHPEYSPPPEVSAAEEILERVEVHAFDFSGQGETVEGVRRLHAGDGQGLGRLRVGSGGRRTHQGGPGRSTPAGAQGCCVELAGKAGNRF